jgi:hypothetical protein
MAFDYNTLDQAVTQVTIADAGGDELRTLAIDNSRSAYEVADMLWGAMDTPQPQ